VNWSRFVPLLVLVLLVAALWRGLGRDPTLVPSPLIGRTAPAFDLPALHDATVRVRTTDLVGQPTLVNVWGTWCVGCRAEHAVLLDLARRGGARIVGLDWKDDREAARAWLRELGDPYAVVAFDAEGRVGIDWGVYGAPETFVLDRHGVIRYKHVGPLTAEDAARVLAPLLRQLAEEAP